MLKIKISWDEFIEKQPFSPFTQKLGMGRIAGNLGTKNLAIRVAENDELIGAAQIIKYPSPFGKNFLYVPRGPGY